MAATVTYIPNPHIEGDWYASEAAFTMMIGLGEKIRSLAMLHAPVETGALRASIEGSVGLGENSRLELQVGSDLSYAGFVEYGTSKMAAQPYLRPALDEAVF